MGRESSCDRNCLAKDISLMMGDTPFVMNTQGSGSSTE